jgi:cytochrome c oxidase subunit 2
MISTKGKLTIVGMLALASILLSSCGGRQSAVDAAGLQASRLESLWWLYFWVCTAVYVIVMAALAIAILRSRKADAATPPEIKPEQGREEHASSVVKGAVGITVVILFVLMIVSFRTGRAINSLQAAPEPITIKVTGNQWWWNIEYQDVKPSNNFYTANEMHLPVGKPVKLELQSTDVIHSFWLPNMHGKKDLIPNYPTTFFFQPDKIGIYDGQCAEFCGYQHAKMRFKVVVESQDDYQRWVVTQQKPSFEPITNAEKRGREVFLTSTCVQCHAVQGTTANGRVGPDLSHIAGRPLIGAGSLENNEDNLKIWITDSQRIKPGNRMPMNAFSDEDLNALVAYLRSLK